MKTTLPAEEEIAVVDAVCWWWLERDGMEQLKKRLRWWMPVAGGVGVRLRVGVTAGTHTHTHTEAHVLFFGEA